MSTATAEIESYKANPKSAPALLRMNIAAAIAGMTERGMRKWIAKGYVRAFKPAGGRVLIDRDSLLDFIERGAPSAA